MGACSCCGSLFGLVFGVTEALRKDFFCFFFGFFFFVAGVVPRFCFSFFPALSGSCFSFFGLPFLPSGRGVVLFFFLPLLLGFLFFVFLLFLGFFRRFFFSKGLVLVVGPFLGLFWGPGGL